MAWCELDYVLVVGIDPRHEYKRMGNDTERTPGKEQSRSSGLEDRLKRLEDARPMLRADEYEERRQRIQDEIL